MDELEAVKEKNTVAMPHQEGWRQQNSDPSLREVYKSMRYQRKEILFESS